MTKILWNYHVLNQEVVRSDILIVMGSQDIGVAKRGAELALEGYAETVICTGGYGKITKDLWKKPEAIVFSETMIEQGVPPEKILLETQSTNTGENIKYSIDIIKENNLHFENLLLVQKPYLERRALATFKKIYPSISATITSERITFEKYIEKLVDLNAFVNLIVGDTQRIMIYPKMGFQIAQDVPENVMVAFNSLVARGFTGQLIREENG